MFLAGVITTESFEAGSVFGDIGPIEALVFPVVIQRHGIGQIVSPDGGMPGVQVYLTDVVAVGEQHRRRHTYNWQINIT